MELINLCDSMFSFCCSLRLEISLKLCSSILFTNLYSRKIDAATKMNSINFDISLNLKNILLNLKILKSKY